MALHYIIGDATEPIKKPSIIAHVCNDCRPGKWGSGFVMALSKKDPRPEQYYREWSEKREIHGIKYALGNVQIAPFKKGIVVANIIGQHGVSYKDGIAPIRYKALNIGLTKLAAYAKREGRTIHAPRLGAKLAGGSWLKIESILKEITKKYDIEIYIYTLSSEKEEWSNCIYENLKDFKND